MKRNSFIDIAKGIAIFLMLWGHCIQICVVGSDIDFFEALEPALIGFLIAILVFYLIFLKDGIQWIINFYL